MKFNRRWKERRKAEKIKGKHLEKWNIFLSTQNGINFTMSPHSQFTSVYYSLYHTLLKLSLLMDFLYNFTVWSNIYFSYPIYLYIWSHQMKSIERNYETNSKALFTIWSQTTRHFLAPKMFDIKYLNENHWNIQSQVVTLNESMFKMKK